MVLLHTAAENEPRRRSIGKEEDDINAAIGLLQLRHYFSAKEQPNNPSFEDNRSTTATTTTATRKNTRSSVLKDRQISKTMNGQGRRTTTPRKKAETRAAKRLLELYINDNLNRSDKGFMVTTPHLKEDEEVKKRLRMGLVDKFKVQDDDEESKSDDGSYITDDSSDMETTLAEITAAQQIVLLSKSHQQPATATTSGGEEEDEESSSSKSSAGVVSSTRRKQDFEEESRRRRRKRKFRSLVDLYKITQPLG